MGRVFRSGPASIEVDQDAMLRALDQVTAGAARRFVARAEATIRPIKAGAEVQWPVRATKSQGSARRFRILEKLSEDRLSVSLINDAPYVYYVRWSVRTRAGIEADAEAQATAWDESAAARGDNHSTHAKRVAYMLAKLRRSHGLGAPTTALAGKRCWDVLVARPGRAATAKLAEDCQQDLDTLARRAHG